MRVLVTGGAGFIGSAVVRYLISIKGYDVLNLDKLTYAGNLASLTEVEGQPNYTFRKVDICDRAALLAAFTEFRPKRVMHLAAESHVDRSIDNSDVFVQTNVIGTLNVLECARKYMDTLNAEERNEFRVLHVSTDEVYGSLGTEGLFSESTPYDPSSPYSASKAASDHLAKAWARTYGLPVVVSNCSNNYGPFHFPEKLIPLTILNALSGRPIPIYGTGQNVRDWLYVDDHARALDLIIEKGVPGETYNVGGRNERTNLEVAREICSILDQFRPTQKPHSSLIHFVTDRPGHDARYAIDASKLERELKWKAQESFDTGIRKTVSWYLQNEWWWKPLQQVYDGKRLGKSQSMERP